MIDSFSSVACSVHHQVEQERVKLQETISKLANIAFDKCISYPGRSLSNSEASCVANTVGRFFDSSEFVMQYYQSKARSAGGGGGY